MSAFYAFGLVLLLLVTVVVVSAIRERESDRDGGDGEPADRLQTALTALRQLEFDRETEKLPEEEYRRLRAAYGRMAVRARDEVAAAGESTASGPAAGEVGPESPTSPGEEEGAPWSHGPSARPGPPPDEPSVPLPCEACGARPSPEARFCPRCGARLPGA